MVIPASGNYLPGLNGNLNALDAWENDIDVFVLDAGEIPEAYKREVEKAFRFKVEFLPIENYTGGLNREGARSELFQLCITTPYVLFKELSKQYKMCSFFGADCMVVNNIMRWFKVAEDSGLIVTANNSYSLVPVQDLGEHFLYPDGVCSEMAVGDTPGIMDMKKHLDVIEETLRLTNLYGDNMRSFNAALINLKKQNQVLALPANLWTSGIYYSIPVIQSMGSKNRPMLFADREEVFAIHRRWWDYNVRHYAFRDQVPGTQNYKHAVDNTNTWERFYRIWNTEWKVKIDYAKYYTSQPS